MRILHGYQVFFLLSFMTSFFYMVFNGITPGVYVFWIDVLLSMSILSAILLAATGHITYIILYSCSMLLVEFFFLISGYILNTLNAAAVLFCVMYIIIGLHIITVLSRKSSHHVHLNYVMFLVPIFVICCMTINVSLYRSGFPCVSCLSIFSQISLFYCLAGYWALTGSLWGSRLFLTAPLWEASRGIYGAILSQSGRWFFYCLSLALLSLFVGALLLRARVWQAGLACAPASSGKNRS